MSQGLGLVVVPLNVLFDHRYRFVHPNVIGNLLFLGVSSLCCLRFGLVGVGVGGGVWVGLVRGV